MQPACVSLAHLDSYCSEIFFDNTTRAFGNDSSIDWVAAGYQTSEHVIAVLGSEDWCDRLLQRILWFLVDAIQFTNSILMIGLLSRYGYSFGWSGDEANLGTQKSLWGTTWTGTTWWDKPLGQGGPNSSRTLATYQFFPSPLRFTNHAWAQVNWHYDTGMIDLVVSCRKLVVTARIFSQQPALKLMID